MSNRDPVTGTHDDPSHPLHYHEYATSGADHEHAHSEPDDVPGHIHPGTNLGPGWFDPQDDEPDEVCDIEIVDDAP